MRQSPLSETRETSVYQLNNSATEMERQAVPSSSHLKILEAICLIVSFGVICSKAFHLRSVLLVEAGSGHT
jgi:hypothetical protein